MRADHDGDAFLAESTSAVGRLTDANNVLHIMSLQLLQSNTCTLRYTSELYRGHVNYSHTHGNVRGRHVSQPAKIRFRRKRISFHKSVRMQMWICHVIKITS